MTRRKDLAATRLEITLRDNEADLARYVRRRLSDSSDADDAYGELLVAAWKNRKRIPTDATAARMWLFVAARNVIFNSRRSRARREAAVDRVASTVAMTATSALEAEIVLDVREAISALEPQDAELVRLVYWDGFRSHEAAQVLGINPSTARSRLAKARYQLRCALAPGDATPRAVKAAASPEG